MVVMIKRLKNDSIEKRTLRVCIFATIPTRPLYEMLNGIDEGSSNGSDE